MMVELIWGGGSQTGPIFLPKGQTLSNVWEHFFGHLYLEDGEDWH